MFKPLYVIEKNSKQGANVKTCMPPTEHSVFSHKGQGLYAWIWESDYHRIKDEDSELPIKFGQYGTNASEGTLPHTTIMSYVGTTTQAFVVLWAYRFTPEDLIAHESALEVEKKVNVRLGPLNKDGTSTESFITSLAKIKKETTAELFGVKESLDVWGPRQRQQEFIDRYTSSRSTNKNSKFLLGTVARYGRNFAWLSAVRNCVAKGVVAPGCNLLVVTPKTSTFDSIKKDIRSHAYFKDWEFVELADDSKPFSTDPSKVSVVVVSTQIAYSKAASPFLELVKGIQFADVLVDECFSGVYSEQFDRFANDVSTSHITFASGIPYNFYYLRGINSQTSYFYSYIDQQLDKNADVQSGIVNNSVTLQMYVPVIGDSVYPLTPFSSREETSFKSFFDTNRDGSFVDEIAVIEFFKDVLGLSEDTNNFSPFRLKNDIDHTVWLLPESNVVARAAQKLLRQLLGSEWQIVVALSDDAKQVRKIQEAIRDHKKTITLTTGRFVEGLSFPEWKGALVMSDVDSLEEYYQFIFRVAAPDNDKNESYVFDFCPQRAFQMIIEMITGEAENKNKKDAHESSKNVFEFFDTFLVESDSKVARVDYPQ